MNLTAQARLREWARQVDDWRASGLTQRKWCKAHGISIESFKYRKGRVEAFAADLMEANGAEIIPIPDHCLPTAAFDFVSANTSDNTIEIEFRGMTIRMNNNISPDMLRIVLEVVSNA